MLNLLALHANQPGRRAAAKPRARHANLAASGAAAACWGGFWCSLLVLRFASPRAPPARRSGSCCVRGCCRWRGAGRRLALPNRRSARRVLGRLTPHFLRAHTAVSVERREFARALGPQAVSLRACWTSSSTSEPRGVYEPLWRRRLALGRFHARDGAHASAGCGLPPAARRSAPTLWAPRFIAPRFS